VKDGVGAIFGLLDLLVKCDMKALEQYIFMKALCHLLVYVLFVFGALRSVSMWFMFVKKVIDMVE
jgi:hypothetical protein